MSSKLRDLLNTEPILVSPGVYDCYSAKVAEMAGFKLLSTTGAGLVNSRLGVPDVGIFSLRDNVDACRMIARSVALPVSADAEAGYGNAATVYYVVREFESAGVSAVSIEDQAIPKRCGHVAGKNVVPLLDMTRKIEAAVAARSSPDFLIVARTDAIATGGIEDAVKRAKAYEAAGADVIFPDAVRGADDISRIVDAVSIPVRINMGFGLRTRTTTPLISVAELRDLGVRWVSLSRILPAAAIRGMSEALRVMREGIETGTLQERPDLVADMSDIQALMDYETFFDVERRFVTCPEGEGLA
ncbi:isocitrate lyase/PEP mutase family protein [Chelativorans sp. AA-79]|uniref:isocitrate lyase/PEP mutase family protein n=1 Tax=Chelativorans sp. AA-79 TaxID=3028735 RepID=UPI0023F8587A|nr:isocitrate lyase/PEP mutase family protein [Chelativorans sp. AA-79]WEX10659.1 isocitrate lyase/PEP mutase family protein [Chelativorans sp. AA-79]